MSWQLLALQQILIKLWHNIGILLSKALMIRNKRDKENHPTYNTQDSFNNSSIWIEFKY